MRRCLIGGFLHETNTFNAEPATWDDFCLSDCYPGFTKGVELLTRYKGMNLAIAGFIEALEDTTALEPVSWGEATPKGKVTDEAYRHLTEGFFDYAPEQVSSLFLDLHGAMVTESLLDGEGPFAQKMRQRYPEAFMLVVLDFHANISDELFEAADFISVYRTYPHVDIAERGAECAKRWKAGDKPTAKALRRIPFLIALPEQCTMEGPMADVFSELDRLEEAHNVTLSFAGAFPGSDSPMTAPCVLGYGQEPSQVDAAVDALCDFITAKEAQFSSTCVSISDAMSKLGAATQFPWVLADVQDNPGAGGTSDTMDIAQAYVAAQLPHKAVLSMVHDPKLVERLLDKPIGYQAALTIGGNHAVGDGLSGNFTLKGVRKEHTTVQAQGSYYGGCQLDPGPSVLLEIASLHIVVSSNVIQAADSALIELFDFKRTDYDVWILKSSVHFRAEFRQYTDRILNVLSPGLNVVELSKLDYQFTMYPPAKGQRAIETLSAG